MYKQFKKIKSNGWNIIFFNHKPTNKLRTLYTNQEHCTSLSAKKWYHHKATQRLNILPSSPDQLTTITPQSKLFKARNWRANARCQGYEQPTATIGIQDANFKQNIKLGHMLTDGQQIAYDMFNSISSNKISINDITLNFQHKKTLMCTKSQASAGKFYENLNRSNKKNSYHTICEQHRPFYK